MSPDDIETFYTCLNSLIHYAATKLDLGFDCKDASMSLGGSRERRAACLVLDELWEHPGLVRHYVAENPDRLTRDQLNDIRLWQYALTDIFVCLEKDTRHMVCVSNRMFEVSALATPFCELVKHMPTVAILTLLPYKGRLVCDGRVVSVVQQTRPRLSAFIDKQMSRATDQPLISTQAQLIDYMRGTSMLS